MSDLQTIQSAHFIGIGGIHVSAVARLLQARGVRVSGSDAVASDETERLIQQGIAVTIGHAATNLPADAQAVIYSDAVPEENPERQSAMERGIPLFDTHRFLGELFKTAKQIVITGTHGKSTTTAMVGKILEAAGLDPTVVVGTRVPGFPLGNLRIGRKDLLVVEGDEFRSHVLSYHPTVLALNNLEWDHPDIFPTYESYTGMFHQVLDQMKDEGKVVWNADDARLESVVGPRLAAPGHDKRFISLGKERGDVQFDLRGVIEGRWHAGIDWFDGPTLEVSLQIPGEMNVRNAAMAATAARAFDPTIESAHVLQALSDFKGIWRRFEYVGKFNGAPIISDYGHHPTEVFETVRAARATFKDRRLVLCYQPHQRARTKGLFQAFLPALAMPDVLLLVEIYDVPGRETDLDSDISSGHLLQAVVQEMGGPRPTKLFSYAADLEDAERQLREAIKPNDVVLVMGAGTVDKIARHLVQPMS